MITIIAGCRGITDYPLVTEAVKISGFDITEVVSGGAMGVDALGERWADENEIPIRRFPAYWKEYGKMAGPMRNKEMAKYAEALIAVWDGKSRGTSNMIDEGRKERLKIYIHRIDGSPVVKLNKE